MDEGVPRDDEVDGLRLRLYRPAPPAGAVDAYLAALDPTRRPPAEPADAPPPPTRPPTGRAVRTGLLVALAGTVAVLLSLLRPTAADPTAPPLPQPAVPGAFVGAMAGEGHRTQVFDALDHWVIVTVLCAGRGTVTVRLAGEAPAVQTCAPGTPSLGMIGSRSRMGRLPVDVSTTEHPRWSLTVGAIGGGSP